MADGFEDTRRARSENSPPLAFFHGKVEARPYYDHESERYYIRLIEHAGKVLSRRYLAFAFSQTTPNDYATYFAGSQLNA
jgi:hypothetical protein